MFTTRRKLTRSIFAGSLATATAPGFTRIKHGIQPKERDIGVTEFLMEWAELAHWREIRQHLAGPMHNSVMLAMSRKYVRDYYERCGEVPTGAHRVSYHCGTDPVNDVQCKHCGPTRFYDELFTYLGGDRIAIRLIQLD